jgi:hypothetical protein
LIKRIFDAYRAEADALGFEAGPEYFALRRRVTVAPTTSQARVYADAVTESAPVDEVAQAHELFGREAIPILRKA